VAGRDPWDSVRNGSCSRRRLSIRVGGDVVARQLIADHVDLAGHHMVDPGGDVGDGDVLLDPVGLAVELALIQPGQVQHRLAEGLGRDGPGVDANTAHHVAAVDDRGPLPQLGRRDGRLLTGRTGADDGEVVGVDDDHSFTRPTGWLRRRTVR